MPAVNLPVFRAGVYAFPESRAAAQQSLISGASMGKILGSDAFPLRRCRPMGNVHGLDKGLAFGKPLRVGGGEGRCMGGCGGRALWWMLPPLQGGPGASKALI